MHIIIILPSHYPLFSNVEGESKLVLLQGQQIVKNYRKKCSLKIAMVRPIDGRTLNGLSDNIATFKLDVSTMSEAGELIVIQEGVTLASVFRADVMPPVGGSELKAAVLDMQRKLPLKNWPHDTILLLLGHKVATQREHREFMNLYDTVDPNVTGDFALSDPKLGSLPNVSPYSKLLTFSNIWYKETLVVLIDEGVVSSDVVLSLVKHCRAQDDMLDPLDLTPEQIDIVKNHSRCCGFLETLLRSGIGIAFKDYYICLIILDNRNGHTFTN